MQRNKGTNNPDLRKIILAPAQEHSAGAREGVQVGGSQDAQFGMEVTVPRKCMSRRSALEPRVVLIGTKRERESDRTRGGIETCNPATPKTTSQHLPPLPSITHSLCSETEKALAQKLTTRRGDSTYEASTVVGAGRAVECWARRCALASVPSPTLY